MARIIKKNKGSTGNHMHEDQKSLNNLPAGLVELEMNQETEKKTFTNGPCSANRDFNTPFFHADKNLRRNMESS